ncbi:hypothetical protein GCM10008090_27590 [Arenicella chitinivorans]|uniref:Uncharacterized protein n=1 Tax=Arenicella chitinivorans TaxID=1329800 RepID=A0A918RYJ2_9GAMM|nr:hypothetical protein [Arenicella chitinivorans]GHA16268.1 hypothetical protein GCM10008090_27590 [Arenicella chitinivorans]
MTLGIVLFLILALFILIQYFRLGSNKHEQERSEVFRRLAAQLGMEYAPKISTDFRKRLKLFSRFSSRSHTQEYRLSTIKNVLRNSVDGVEKVFFECSLRGASTGRNMEPVFYFRSASLALPNFHVRLFNTHQARFLQSLGQGGVKVDHPTFSQKYLVRCSDESAVRKLFSDEFLDFISNNDSFDIDGNGDQMIVYRAMYEDGSTGNMGRLDPKEFRDVEQKAVQIFQYLSRRS